MIRSHTKKSKLLENVEDLFCLPLDISASPNNISIHIPVVACAIYIFDLPF